MSKETSAPVDELSKLREAVHYVCRKMALKPQKLGAVKLQKIIWYFDVRSFQFTMKTVTGAVFVKKEFGPYSRDINLAIKELVSANRLVTDKEEFFDKEKTRLVGKGSTDTSLFSDREIRWLDEITEDICENHTADSISERSHGPVWKMAELEEVIPFAATVIKLRKPSTDLIDKMKKELGLA